MDRTSSASATSALTDLSPAEVRARIRTGAYSGPTAGLARGYVQANFVALPLDWAGEFATFCERNRQACPVLATTQPGSTAVPELALDADLRTDIPSYLFYRAGKLDAEVPDIKALWRQDMVCFLLGCSFTFDHYLLAAGLPVRHIEQCLNVAMYRTSILTVATARLSGPLVVSMRPMPAQQVERARQISARFPDMHGAPVHTGDPTAIGIADLARPDYGDAVMAQEGDVPMFWACGVTPQAIAIASRVPFMITHAPGNMFLTDRQIAPAFFR